MLAIIDAISNDIFTNQFIINDWLEDRYYILMQKFTKNSQFGGTTGIHNPFWHLESDGFWHLHYPGLELSKTSTPSTKWLKENVRYASLDDDLWILLQNKAMRQRLRDYIVEYKLGGEDRGLLKVAENLGLLTGLLLAVA